MYDGYYKRAFHVELDVIDGIVVPDPAADIAKSPSSTATTPAARRGWASSRGFGLSQGPSPASTNCDNQNLVMVGTSDDEIRPPLGPWARSAGAASPSATATCSPRWRCPSRGS